MGVRFPSVQSNTLVNANVAINAETIVLTTAGLTPPLDSAVVLLVWFMIHTVGATAGGSTYRLRRGNALTSPLINLAVGATVTAGNTVLHSGSYFDTPGAVSGQQYTLTCIDTGSTAVGAINDASLLAFAL